MRIVAVQHHLLMYLCRRRPRTLHRQIPRHRRLLTDGSAVGRRLLHQDSLGLGFTGQVCLIVTATVFVEFSVLCYGCVHTQVWKRPRSARVASVIGSETGLW